MTLTISDVKRGIIDTLDTITSTGTSLQLYGLFYKGKLFPVSGARVYSQPGRAKAELIRKFKYFIHLDGNYNYDYDKADVTKVIDELLADGTLEIRLL